MVRRRRGFTLIEVSLFLAISGLLFLGVTIGVQSSIRQQRYNDSVQSFAEFLRSAYSEVLNVQNLQSGGGRSEQATYGKLLVFGEKNNLAGESNGDNSIFMYTVIGDASQTGLSGTALTQLQSLNASILQTESAGISGDTVNLIGDASSYTPRWQVQIEQACGRDCVYNAFRGAILIVRHPSSGVVNTFYTNEVFEVNEAIKNRSVGHANEFKRKIGDNNTFKAQQIDFCINPEPGSSTTMRRDVRIVKNARNVSGVEIVADDSEDNACKKS